MQEPQCPLPVRQQAEEDNQPGDGPKPHASVPSEQPDQQNRRAQVFAEADKTVSSLATKGGFHRAHMGVVILNVQHFDTQCFIPVGRASYLRVHLTQFSFAISRKLLKNVSFTALEIKKELKGEFLIAFNFQN